MSDEKEPRRYKLPSEYSDADRAAKRRFGGDGRRPERDQYVRWRQRTLRTEQDDLALRERLLSEQAETLRNRAGDQGMAALEALSVEDHHAHLSAIWEARETGVEPPKLKDGGASKLEAQAEQLEAEAQEISDHLAQELTT